MKNYIKNEIEFYKYEGTGNDFVLIDEFKKQKIENKGQFAKIVCRRSFGIGADGVLYLMKNKDGLPLMHMYNPDGTGPDMCGNGIRCIALHCKLFGYIKSRNFLIDTNVGIKSLSISKLSQNSADVNVDMGKVSFDPCDIPIKTKHEFVQKKIKIPGYEFVGTAASIGNPHLLIIIENEKYFEQLDKNLEQIGPKLENHYLFPNRINVHFCLIENKDKIKLLTWERGAGRTKACGTGATTSVAILHRLGLINLPCMVNVPGGNLVISNKYRNKELHWIMNGNAKYVFRGFVNVSKKL